VYVSQALTNTTPGKVYTLLNAAASILACFIYVWMTYLKEEDPVYQALNYIELVFNCWFIVDYLILLYASLNKCAYVLQPESMADLVALLPFIAQLTEDNSIFDFFKSARFFRALSRPLRAFRAMRVMRAYRVVRFAENSFVRKTLNLLLIIVVFLFMATGAVYTLDQQLAVGEDGKRPFAGGPLQFHDCLYYIIISFSTVGYGDIYPDQPLTRLLLSLLLPVFVVLFSVVGSQLFDLQQEHDKYASARYNPKPGIGHIVITGGVGVQQLERLLDQLYHEANMWESALLSTESLDALKVVVLSKNTPNDDVQDRILDNPHHDEKVEWLRGSALNNYDLERCVIAQAKAVFVLTDPTQSEADAEDAFAVMCTIAVNQTCPEVRVLVQLIHAHSMQYLEMANCDAISVQQVRTASVARSSLYQGTHVFIDSLFRPLFRDEGSAAIPTGVDPQSKGQLPPWMQEYTEGLRSEIHKALIAPIFEGKTFQKVAQIVAEDYADEGVSLIGVCDRGTHAPVLNPGTSWVVKPGSRGIFVTKSRSRLQTIEHHYWDLEDPLRKEDCEKLLVRLSQEDDGAETISDTISDPEVMIKRFHQEVLSMSVSSHSKQRSLHHASTALQGLSTASAALQASISRCALDVEKTSEQAVGELRAQVPGLMGHIQDLQRCLAECEASDDHWKRRSMDEMNGAARRVSRIAARPSINGGVMGSIRERVVIPATELGPEVEDHLLFIGGLDEAKLFQLALPPSEKVVVLSMENHECFDVPDGMLMLQGSALERDDLKRAAVLRAKKVVFFTQRQGSEIDRQRHDQETILGTENVRALCGRDMPVMVCLLHESYIQFLSAKNHLAIVLKAPPAVERLCWPTYAAGNVYDSSFVDALLVQAFLKPYTLELFWQFLSDTLIQFVLTAEVCQAAKLQSPVTWGALSRHLLQRYCVVGIALLRNRTHSEADMPFVVVSPSPDALCYEGDCVIVLQPSLDGKPASTSLFKRQSWDENRSSEYQHASFEGLASPKNAALKCIGLG